MAENGKLKRLLIPKEIYSKGLYDILYYEGEAIQEKIAQNMIILSSFQSLDFKELQTLTKIIKDFSPYQLIVDNFPY